MSNARRVAVLLAVLTCLLLSGVPAAVAQADRSPAQLWRDFNHYVLIARPDMAAAAGQSLLNQVQLGELLDLVESSDYADYEPVLARAGRMEAVRDVAKELGMRLQSARIERSRDVERIRADIALLAEGRRANLNATDRLRAAGQYAAPLLLATLEDPAQEAMQPFVLQAMVAVGRPLVYPLSVALPDLEPVTQGQVARVLAEIGYPLALPYMRAVIENEANDPAARRTVQTAFDRLAATSRIAPDITAARLFYQLGMNQYTAATNGEQTVGFDPATGQGLIWAYLGRDAGLVPTPVPGAVFGDVLAMRSSRAALQLDPHMDAALSLWLMANLRRENRLAEGQVDPSYGPTMRPPAFYIMLAGPLRQHDVLNRALDDGDAELALDAIAALSATAGTEALVNVQGTVQPLLRALSYPDRRVRYSAAIALANARFTSVFPEAHRVTPVLSEAVRQSDQRVAVVIGRDQATANRLQATMNDLGFQTHAGTGLAQVAEAIGTGPGIDLLVVSHAPDAVEQLLNATVTDYKLATVPLLAIVSPGEQIELNRRLGGHPRIRSTVTSASDQELRSAVEQTMEAMQGVLIGPDEGTHYALAALGALDHLAASHQTVFNVADAQAALIAALGDDRDAVATGAAGVLSRLDDAAAQQALAQAAIGATDASLQVAFLNALAESATRFGAKLEEMPLRRVSDLVRSGEGDVAVAASRAHGALTLPTAAAVQLIVE